MKIKLIIFFILFSFCSDNRTNSEIYTDILNDLEKVPDYVQDGVLCSLLDEQLYTEYQDPFSNDEYAKYLIYNDDEGNYLGGEQKLSDDDMYMLKANVSEEVKSQYKRDLFKHIKFISSDIYWNNCTSVDQDNYFILFEELEMNISDLLQWGYITPYEICNYSGTANIAADNVLLSLGSSCREFLRWKG